MQLGGDVVAAVERKTVEDLAASLLSGRMTYAVAELATMPRAAVVVEDRYRRLFQLEHVRGAAVAEALAELQARFPSVPVTFCETRQLAQEWTYRWLGACLHELDTAHTTSGLETTFAAAGPIDQLAGPIGAEEVPPRPAVVRAWARAHGLAVSDKGRIPAEVTAAFLTATR